MRRISLAVLLLFVCSTLSAATRDSAEIHQALKKLTILGSVLYVAAHPDDENTALISYYSNDRLYRTGYLSMTRGDGGQNLIGDEKGELLGVLRTQELLAARRIDGGEQFFTRAIDFGFSKNPTETLAIWGHDTILADVVWTIRRFQPDVIITRFPTTGEGGHGHHTASAMLAIEAFNAAGDPTKFPEQMKYTNVWQPSRIFWNRFMRGQVDPNDPALAKSLRVDIGTYNQLLGRSYTEMAAESRSMHKSQGFGSAERRGTLLNYLDQLGGEPATQDPFEGINTTWGRWVGGEAVGKILQEAYDTYDPKDPSKSLPVLLRAYDAMSKLGAADAWHPRVNPWIAVKMRDLMNVIQACAGLSIDVSAADSAVTPDGRVTMNVTVTNRSNYPFKLLMVAGRYADPGKGVNVPLENNKPVRTDIDIKMPTYADVSQPYWLASAGAKGSFTVTNPAVIGLAENPSSIPLVVTIGDDQFHTITFTVPGVYRWTDPVKGEQVRPVDVVPDVTANVSTRVYVFPDAKAKPVSFWLHNNGQASSAKVRVEVPQGWKAEPKEKTVAFSGKGAEEHVTFTVTPPAAETTGVITAEVELPTGKKWRLGVTNIDYSHIPAQRVFGDAAAKLVRVNVKKRGARIGYIMGPGDEVAEALRQIGYEVTLISDQDLERGEFSQFDAIVTGVRAYNTRRRLKLAHPTLLEYVKNGGTLVVQYNTVQDLIIESPGPLPFKITNDRVTVEEAPVKFVSATHPLLTTPNKITDADFKDWVQERGLYFTQNWDPKYETVLASNDPGEPEKQGGELYTKYGKGVFVYTSYAWFRQLPAGVPGAYRLFANLVSARQVTK